MARKLSISTGAYSDKGRKKINQDFNALRQPKEPLRTEKGFAVALADGISTSSVSDQASKAAVNGFLEDYFSTPETWSVKKSAQCVLSAINSWLYSQNQRTPYRYNPDTGYVCTFSALVVKSSTAYIFHTGDNRIYRLNNNRLEALTREHRVAAPEGKHYLKHALGIDARLSFDYQSLKLEAGDTFLLVTDGIFESVTDEAMAGICREYAEDLNVAAQQIAEQAYLNGSEDNLTVQIVRIDDLPLKSAGETLQAYARLPFVPALQPGSCVDGLRMIRPLHVSGRSHVYLAKDEARDQPLVFKIPASEIHESDAALERFLLEEWIAKKINNTHVLRPYLSHRKRHYFYSLSEYVEGQTLAEWMQDNPKPSLAQVRNIIEQIAKGLQAFHRLEMIHQDLRPENILIDNEGTVKIIDFGSTWVAGLEELSLPVSREEVLGTVQYAAPEYFLGEYGTAQSDMFSLAVMTYQMLAGRLPYGNAVAKSKTRAAQRKLKYKSVLHEHSDIPVWVDLTLRKALQPDPFKRYDEITEFIADLRKPNPKFIHETRPPLLERNPVLFWQLVSGTLLMAVVYLAGLQLSA
ncbi:bifunctional protein-serine/threonine kinase/phosphatase [Reinekea marinisedimentorum]|uniref:Serine/threonine protein phosphatase PrpC n=1 Tax=Reinekea marinisedimentorum TaxID=230495 RepID=A0A4R3I5S7_9GAMM|nr:bifunctional protein-serine/threonine kinase/phosphatase [Reinekea marinisedimentorum]TCS41048.1 serine/threonine protein phosphatase PrpC [Reinekea marinisedimentorum]